jgi:hypothetical protein
MTFRVTHSLLAATACLLTACASPKICTREIPKTHAGAAALLASSQRAHGASAFAKVRDVSVRYEGRWASIGPRFQPVLSDRGFRRGSEERVLFGPRVVAQEHIGPAGKKLVVRTPGKVTVGYNGSLSTDEETSRAAALVADAYTLFLLGPFYFDRPGVVLAPNGEAAAQSGSSSPATAAMAALTRARRPASSPRRSSGSARCRNPSRNTA